MTLIRLKLDQVPIIKLKMLIAQDGRCAIQSCRVKLSPKDACLDHDHKLGSIRAVLCRNCNGIEGKVKNLATRAKRDGTPLFFLKSLIAYWEHHENNPSVVLYPTYKTADEKRVRKNVKAKKARASKKVTKKK